ncbi:hypothetical protein F5Y03DRAFT_190437 [Xylaria venustula]|nr:hypothetical protein F5Y03DRAFT_190437 [Xylaria venustula]
MCFACNGIGTEYKAHDRRPPPMQICYCVVCRPPTYTCDCITCKPRVCNCVGCRAKGVSTEDRADNLPELNRAFHEYATTTRYDAPNNRTSSAYETATLSRPAARQKQTAKIPEAPGQKPSAQKPSAQKPSAQKPSAQKPSVRSQDTDRSDGWHVEVHRGEKKVVIKAPTQNDNSNASQSRDVKENLPRNVHVNIEHITHHHYHYHNDNDNDNDNHGNSRSAQQQPQTSHDSKRGETQGQEEKHKAKTENQGSSKASGSHAQQPPKKPREEIRGQDGKHQQEKQGEKNKAKNEGKVSGKKSR